MDASLHIGIKTMIMVISKVPKKGTKDNCSTKNDIKLLKTCCSDRIVLDGDYIDDKK